MTTTLTLNHIPALLAFPLEFGQVHIIILEMPGNLLDILGDLLVREMMEFL